MSMWILAILIMVALALAGWRQGAIRAAICFVGIIFAALLAAPLGHLVHPLLPHLGVRDPITAWAVAPLVGFILGSIPFWVAAHMVHVRVEHHYKYRASELQLALYTRLNNRLGICLGLLNGVPYVVLASFFIFNAAYWTTQATKDPTDLSEQPLMTRLVSHLGNGLQASGFSQAAAGVGLLSPNYYRLADFTGLMMQNPQLGPRLADYPGFISLWHRNEMQSLVTDANLTNALASGASLNEILGTPSVQGLLANKDLQNLVLGALLNNLDDLTKYLNTGQSSKYGKEPVLGNWRFNAGVSLAWLRQDQPKMPANEMAAYRALWIQAYGGVDLLLTADNQVFVKNWPKFVAQPQPNQPPFQPQDGQGDWSRDGSNYSVHFNLNGEDKYLTVSTDGLRMRVKDGRNMLVFDHVNQ